MFLPWAAQMEATPLTTPTLSVVHVSLPLLSREISIHEAIAAALALGTTVPIPAALTSVY